jgi:ankyrin repeat protein
LITNVPLNHGRIKRWLSAHNFFVTDDNVSLAAWTGNVEAMERHVIDGEDVGLADHNGWTTLHMAVWNMHAEVIDLLLQLIRQHTLSAQNSDHESALHLAIFNDDSDTVKNLLSAGADPASQDINGITPIYWGAQNRSIYAIKALIEAGVDVSVRNRIGVTPMHWAACYGHIDVIQVLRRAGADVSVRNSTGATPMHWAAYNGHVHVIKVLKDAGADVSARDNIGRTPMYFAAQNRHTNAINALKEAGAHS